MKNENQWSSIPKSEPEVLYSENLLIDPNPLERALKEAQSEKNSHIFHVKEECYDPDYEYEWDRVLRMRAENHPLMLGGRNNGVKLKPSYHFRHKDKLSQRKFHSMY